MTNIISSVHANNKAGALKTELSVQQFTMLADEPLSYGGDDFGPTPADYLCMSLASCQAITLRMYANRKNWPVDNISVKVDFIRAADMPSGVNTFYVEVALPPELDDAQRGRMLDIAKACPLHRMLTKPSDIITKLKNVS